jgi:hypothetical protein
LRQKIFADGSLNGRTLCPKTSVTGMIREEKRPVEIAAHDNSRRAGVTLLAKEIDHEQKNNKDKFWKTQT